MQELFDPNTELHRQILLMDVAGFPLTKIAMACGCEQGRVDTIQGSDVYRAERDRYRASVDAKTLADAQEATTKYKDILDDFAKGKPPPGCTTPVAPHTAFQAAHTLYQYEEKKIHEKKEEQRPLIQIVLGPEVYGRLQEGWTALEQDASLARPASAVPAIPLDEFVANASEE